VHDAPDTEAVILVGVARLAALQAAAPLDGNRPGLCGARREPAVGRIDHQRGAPRGRVVFAPVRNRRIRCVDLSREDVDTCQIAVVADSDIVQSLGVLGVGQVRSRAELRRPLERHTVFTLGRPFALQIRIAPGGALAPPRVAGRLRPATRVRWQVNRNGERHRACRDRADQPSVHV
jgi:hypothetical protein